jgi:CBS domain containing-hemolysin-like protein
VPAHGRAQQPSFGKWNEATRHALGQDVSGRLVARPKVARVRGDRFVRTPLHMLPLLAAFGCILVNAFFVAAEFALAKVRPTSLEALAKDGDASAKRAHAITHKLDAYLSATQLGITLASLGLGWLGEPAMVDLLAPPLRAVGLGEHTAERVAIAIGFAVISTLHIILGELVPKSLAIAKPEDVARRSSFILHAFFIVTYPALWLLTGTSRLVLRALGLPAPDHAEGKLSLEELRLVIHHNVDDVDETRRAMLQRVIRATQRTARSIMVPRGEMHMLSLTDGPEEWLKHVRSSGFSRYPVSADGEPDHIVGYVYVKDLFMRPHGRRPRAISSLRRDILMVPPGRTLSELLEDFQRTKIPMALVIDEHGGTIGLVTVEDVVKEIVGDVAGEVSQASHHQRVDADGSIVAEGRTTMEDIELDGESVEGAKDGTSVAAWIVERLGHLAAPGDVVDLGTWEAEVEDVRARRVNRVRFRRKSDPPPAMSGLVRA